uniref:HAT C-terminal dimerisation domain-containing protein n=1 Tax=Latimeria chalumnae TaxID=7897 RepID=H3AIW8_LATCH
ESSFEKEWTVKWPCIQPLKNDPEKALCTVCNDTFRVTHQGKRDVERHLTTEHKRLAQMFKVCKPLTSVFAAGTLQNKVINAEVLFTGFILEHNLPLEAAAHAAPLFRKMFPDSAIAKKYGLAVDGSSDTGTESMYLLVVRIFDINRGFGTCLVSDSRAKGIFAQVSDAFKKYNIPWENVIGLSLDNASVNMGRHNGLYTQLEKQNKSTYTAGCSYHVIHNTISYAAKAFAEGTRFNVDDFLIDLFYYFDKSTKRQASHRALKQYPSLKSYFASQSEGVQDPSNFLSDQKLVIGFSTRMTTQKHNLLPTKEAAIVKGCRSFLVAACQYAFSHLPFTNVLLQHAEVLQFENREVADFDSLVYFVERFPTLKAKLDDKMDQLYDQWTAYKLLPDSVVENGRIDKIWSQLGRKKQEDGARKFDFLFKIAKRILVLPHSNAEEERIFSTMRKNKTTFRASLSNKTTLPSILTCKTNCFNQTPCYTFVPSKSLLQNAKSAASTYNSDHS